MRQRVSRSQRTVRAVMLAALMLTTSAQAHQPPVNEPQGALALFAGLGWQTLRADEPYPVARLPGILESGTAMQDNRGSGLEYAELGLRARIAEDYRAYLKYARHGSDGANQLEEGWIDRRQQTQGLAWRAGRQLMPLGELNTQHRHAWSFGVAPMVLRAVINESWRADGIKLDYQYPSGASIGAGVWRNQGFPGAPGDGPSVASMRAGVTQGDWRLEAGYARAKADGRALITTKAGMHTHNLPDCDRVDSDTLCFVGDVDLLAAAVGWAPAQARYRVAAEWWWKRDQGRLDSVFGSPAYQGVVNGGWLDLGWRVTPELELIARLERALASHTLNGVNAALVADQAGIAASDGTLSSTGLVMAWRPLPGQRLTMEWHRERWPGSDHHLALLRYQWQFNYVALRGDTLW